MYFNLSVTTYAHGLIMATVAVLVTVTVIIVAIYDHEFKSPPSSIVMNVLLYVPQMMKSTEVTRVEVKL